MVLNLLDAQITMNDIIFASISTSDLLNNLLSFKEKCWIHSTAFICYHRAMIYKCNYMNLLGRDQTEQVMCTHDWLEENRFVQEARQQCIMDKDKGDDRVATKKQYLHMVFCLFQGHSQLKHTLGTKLHIYE